MTTTYSARLARGKQQHGDKFDPSELEVAHPTIREAFESGLRVRVRTTYSNGETFERTGKVSTTTGWRPAYILMHRSNASGSWDVLGPRDEVVAVWRGKRYEAGTVYGRTYASA